MWEGHIVSASLDGLIKIWEPADPSTGLVVNPQPIFTFPEQVGALSMVGCVRFTPRSAWLAVCSFTPMAGWSGRGGESCLPNRFTAEHYLLEGHALPLAPPPPAPQEPGQRNDGQLSGILALCGVADAQVRLGGYWPD